MIENKSTFVFDMDGTLAECREKPVYDKNKLILQQLMLKGNNVLIVSAGSCKRILNQLNATGILAGKIYIMGNYGLDCATVYDGKVIEENKHSYKNELDEKKLNDFLDNFRKQYGLEKFLGESHVVFDSGLIAFCVLGTNAPQEDKQKYDPKQTKRQSYVEKILKLLPENLTAYVAGQTSIDILKKTYDKNNTIIRWAAEHCCPLKEIVFFGDEITMPYGNDSSILNSKIDYIEVKTCKETAKHFSKLFKDLKCNKEFDF